VQIFYFHELMPMTRFKCKTRPSWANQRGERSVVTIFRWLRLNAANASEMLPTWL
jgi:hypothetical protein